MVGSSLKMALDYFSTGAPLPCQQFELCTTGSSSFVSCAFQVLDFPARMPTLIALLAALLYIYSTSITIAIKLVQQVPSIYE